MHESHEHLQTLTEIRSLMERSSKFLSLSGLSGVSAGLVALGGAVAVYMRMQTGLFSAIHDYQPERYANTEHLSIKQFLVLVAVVVLVLALLSGTYFTVRKARRQGTERLESIVAATAVGHAGSAGSRGRVLLSAVAVQFNLAGVSGYADFLRPGPAQWQQVHPPRCGVAGLLRNWTGVGVAVLAGL